MTEKEVLEVVRAYIAEHDMKMQINNTQELEEWIDGNRCFNEAVWVINATNLAESALDGNYLYSFVVRKSTGKVDDVSSI